MVTQKEDATRYKDAGNAQKRTTPSTNVPMMPSVQTVGTNTLLGSKTVLENKRKGK